MAEVTHAQVEEELSALLDGDLSPERAAELEAHLAACPDCAALRDDLRRTQDLLAGLAVQAPRDFVPRLQRTIEQRSRGRFFAQAGAGRLPYEAVAVVMLVVLATLAALALGYDAPLELGWDLSPPGAQDGGEGSWGDPRGATYRVRPAEGAEPGRVRQRLAELALAHGLQAPRREASLLVYSVPPGALGAFLGGLAGSVPLRVDRLPAAPRGEDSPVPVEVVLP